MPYAKQDAERWMGEQMKVTTRVAVGAMVGLLLGSQATAAHKPAKTPPAPTRPQAPAAPVAHVIPETGVFDAADLVAVAKLAAKGAPDQFSDDPSLRYVGRDFTFTLAGDRLDVAYDKATHKLTISTGGYGDGWALDRAVVESHYAGQNSFGAQAQVTKRRGDIWGVALPDTGLNRKPIAYVIELEPNAARDFSKAIVLRISGRIKLAVGIYAKKDSIVFQHELMTDATVASPFETWLTQWFLAADITKVEWIDSRTGTVLPSKAIPSVKLSQ